VGTFVGMGVEIHGLALAGALACGTRILSFDLYCTNVEKNIWTNI
jgi:hypothetical protein